MIVGQFRYSDRNSIPLERKDMDSGMYQPIPEGFWPFMDVEIERRLGKLTDEEARVVTLSKIREHFENEAPLRKKK